MKVTSQTYLRLALLLLVGALLFSACKTTHKHRQQPKRGPMPCPVYDC